MDIILAPNEYPCSVNIRSLVTLDQDGKVFTVKIFACDLSAPDKLEAVKKLTLFLASNQIVEATLRIALDNLRANEAVDQAVAQTGRLCPALHK